MKALYWTLGIIAVLLLAYFFIYKPYAAKKAAEKLQSNSSSSNSGMQKRMIPTITNFPKGTVFSGQQVYSCDGDHRILTTVGTDGQVHSYDMGYNSKCAQSA